MNYMYDICRLLGITPREEFDLVEAGGGVDMLEAEAADEAGADNNSPLKNPYHISSYGLIGNDREADPQTFLRLLRGDLRIEKRKH